MCHWGCPAGSLWAAGCCSAPSCRHSRSRCSSSSWSNSWQHDESRRSLAPNYAAANTWPPSGVAASLQEGTLWDTVGMLQGGPPQLRAEVHVNLPSNCWTCCIKKTTESDTGCGKFTFWKQEMKSTLYSEKRFFCKTLMIVNVLQKRWCYLREQQELI